MDHLTKLKLSPIERETMEDVELVLLYVTALQERFGRERPDYFEQAVLMANAHKICSALSSIDGEIGGIGKVLGGM